jgi:hypothetical protein
MTSTYLNSIPGIVVFIGQRLLRWAVIIVQLSRSVTLSRHDDVVRIMHTVHMANDDATPWWLLIACGERHQAFRLCFQNGLATHKKR